METARTDTNIAVGDYRDLLDIVDNLRLNGVGRYVDLPEIIVCGDQSAGKSSVLEAISGMPFPIRDGLCTRFATELVLRRGLKTNTKVSITPGETRLGEDRERLENWQPRARIDMEGLGAVTEEAESAMAIPAGTGAYYEDILRIELTGPDQPHLTMVDLPGLYAVENKKQSYIDVNIVHDMVERYMSRPRSIILTVVSAKYEYVLQKVTQMAKNADPRGLRTMGLITKPDTLDLGSPSEDYFVRLAQNLEEELQLGWHVLKNRNFEERDVTSAQRDDIEKEFFSRGLWNSIDSSHCGVAALKIRLSRVLKGQILVQLPNLQKDVEESIHDCIEKLDHLGPVRGTPQQQRSYLLRVSEEYTSLMSQAVEGTYTDPFFGGRQDRASFNRRLRAVVRLRLDEFAKDMRLKGKSQHIIDSESEDEGDHELYHGPSITRSEFIDDVAGRLKYNRGRELPGLFNPLIVNDLFVEQCAPWKDIVMHFGDDIMDAVQMTTDLIVEQISASEVSEGVLKLIHKEIEGLKVNMDAQIDALLASAAQHLITSNSQLTRDVQRTQQNRHKRAITALINDMFGKARFDGSDKKISINPIELLKLAGEGREPDMERFGSALAVDYMKAYYKVAVDRFTDDVSVLAIEACLISKLSSLFRSGYVAEMSDEELFLLAGETEESRSKREHLEAKRGILEKGLQDLKSLYKHRTIIDLTNQKDPALEDSKKVTDLTQNGFEKSSVATSSIGIASEGFSAKELSNVEEKPPEPLQADDRGTYHGSMKDIWSSSMDTKSNRKTLKEVLGEEPSWGS
ncbi:P-loop containing nucleoside triphosphate hydrolase protein [Fusarium tricinctum]|uniref:P-loop containing nucleoside triphosphate hydrolase protein n=1 Tax=Fusarium tricinctum TaxID=61284 RepID=A0A8K0RV56_9HYPO|nr:P-loop containing nucleoside triphosphate hydrolase protein [Fusarium tricinctum]